MFTYDKQYDIIVIGAGHAGCEAALAAARMGFQTLLLTMNLDSIAQMSCNPAIGGLGKGHIVREVDALGGEMARVTDRTGLQFRMLNTKKGPAVWAPRAQADKKLYQFTMKHVLEKQERLDIMQGAAEEILMEGGRVCGIETEMGVRYLCRAAVITTGTFLKGLIHVGESQTQGGRMGDPPSRTLSDSLRRLGFEIGRLKTGTPPRVNRRSIDFSKLEVQPGDPHPLPFSFSTVKIRQKQLVCYIGYTNEKTHGVIRANLHRSPLYAGRIKGIGPRYCPSIEDKVVRFPEKTRHQIFFEPEGRNTEEYYLNGLSTSLPPDVQIAYVRTIEGLEEAQIMRFGYAVEYDYVPPTQLKESLETKRIENLFFAGQINGTTGYEEAACQGLMAGINAGQKLKGKEPLILGRHESYIGVLIDDLVTKGADEPYRMFTSRAEYRLLLRQDNADLRLMKYGHEVGLISDAYYEECLKKKEQIREMMDYLKNQKAGNKRFDALLRRPEVGIEELPWAPGELQTVPEAIRSHVELEVKYEGYIQKEIVSARKMVRLEERKIPEDFPFEKVRGLKKEAYEKLVKIRPRSIGQAARIQGITPCDISLLMVELVAAGKSLDRYDENT
ncbi:MAG: tRNA uridine-5-carboxymethylaminomethyl(34) synthesis enzyme MnmG [Candidatus Omnitrophica bacterium]|nr:tRNA uridine-5-carboxymethylaminomethyl(34) synthesis enzyme MnmG [Candidatus Omnitrophota bacterium]